MAPEMEVLLVEDNPADLELTLYELRHRHLANAIHVARDGEKALEFLFGGDGSQSLSVKLVLLDVRLPKVDGLEVLRSIRSNERTKTLPVVMLTASKEERDLLESYHLGVNAYMRKPVDFGDFRRIVQQIGMSWLLINEVAAIRVSPLIPSGVTAP
ncbi:MAG TPA: response regulator [Terriglobia bacterium]|nr:response regulator [Terriglobia bacterium]